MSGDARDFLESLVASTQAFQNSQERLAAYETKLARQLLARVGAEGDEGEAWRLMGERTGRRALTLAAAVQVIGLPIALYARRLADLERAPFASVVHPRTFEASAPVKAWRAAVEDCGGPPAVVGIVFTWPGLGDCAIHNFQELKPGRYRSRWELGRKRSVLCLDLWKEFLASAALLTGRGDAAVEVDQDFSETGDE